MRTVALVLFVAVLAVPSGCGSGKPPTVKAGGKVTVKGQPAGGALVVFHPKAAGRENDPKPVATTRDDGTFDLTTFEADDGALEGEYGVTVVWNAKPAAGQLSLGEGSVGQDRLGGRYGNPAQPALSATVAKGQPNQFTFTLD